MQDTGPSPENLPRGECLRLMSTVGVGRIVYTRRALPAVDLVNFTLDGADIVITTHRDDLASAVSASVVAFETDHFSPHNKTGWSVTVIGQVRETTSPGSVAGHDHTLRVTPEIVSDRTLRLIPGNPQHWVAGKAS